jgi:hypothetical protein
MATGEEAECQRFREGKRSDTEGHNMDIKSRRESAVRAGDPAACVAPDSEAQA